jgi:hypothetical protein
MEKKSNEDSKDQRNTKVIGTDKIIVSKEALVNLMNQQVMKIFIYHDYIVSQSLDYGLNRFVTLEQNYIDLMT